MIKFDTPGSHVNRLWSTHAILDVPSRMFKWSLQTPVAQAGIEGMYTWDDRLKAANFSMTSNQQEIFSVVGQLRQYQVEEDTVIEPYFLLQFKNGMFGPVRLGGKVETSAKKFNGKLNLEGLTSKPITIKGMYSIASFKGLFADALSHRCDWFMLVLRSHTHVNSGCTSGTGAMKKNNRMKIEGLVDGPNVNINFHSSYKSEESVDSFTLGAKYSFGGKPHEDFDFKSKINREKRGSLYTQNFFAAVQVF